MITIKASRPYREQLGGAAEVEHQADSPLPLRELFRGLARQYPGLLAWLELDPPRLQSEVLFFSGGRFLRLDDIVQPDAVIELLPPTAGG